MTTSTFSVRVDSNAKKRLEKLAKATGRSRSFLAAEAIDAYLGLHEWQIAGIRQAIQSMDAGKGVDHRDVRSWVESWGARREKRPPGRT